MPFNYKAFSNRVRALRKDAGLSLDDLAKRSGISKGHLHSIESVPPNPTIETVVMLAHALGVSVRFLLGSNAEGELGGGTEDTAFIERYLTRSETVRTKTRKLVDIFWGQP
jgi:transcriptional regulator with XRE-family HTH domain